VEDSRSELTLRIPTERFLNKKNMTSSDSASEEAQEKKTTEFFTLKVVN